MTETNRVLAIGLDGGTFDLLLPLVEKGYLPNISRVLDTGSWGRLNSTIPPFTPVAWSTFATGKNPGGHGILTFEKRNAYHYHQEVDGFVDSRQLKNTLWDILSAANKHVGVINVPLTYPPHRVNGFMITGMMTPSSSHEFTYPPELSEQLHDYLIDVEFIREDDSFRRYGLPSKAEMMHQIHQMTQLRTATTLKLLQEKAWDFLMVVYTSTDRISHFLWNDLMSICTDSDETDPEIAKLILDYFMELDAGIGQLIESAGQETTIVFMSDHGFGASPTRRFYVNVWLEQLGLLQRRKSQGLWDKEYWRVKIGRNKQLKALLRRIVPQSTQDKVTNSSRSQSMSIIDWERTQAYFVVIYFHVCGIEINLTDSKAQGIVSPGDEYEAIRDTIILAAKALKDDKNQPIVDFVARREDVYSGSYIASIPDIILVLNPDYVGFKSMAGTQLVEPNEPFREGEHRQDGIFMASGPVIEKNENLSNLDLADVSATILHILDVAVPTSFDGRVLTEIFSTDYQDSHPVKIQVLTHDLAYAVDGHDQSAEDEAEVERRLRGLGYMD